MLGQKCSGVRLHLQRNGVIWSFEGKGNLMWQLHNSEREIHNLKNDSFRNVDPVNIKREPAGGLIVPRHCMLAGENLHHQTRFH